MRDIIRALVTNHVLANVVLVMILVAGGIAMFSMHRQDLPELVFYEISIGVSYPGANPKEVEEGISRLIEPVVDGLEGVDTYHTFSGEGYSQVFLELEEGVDLDDVKSRVEQAVDSISDFPPEAREPNITVEKNIDEVINLALWGEIPSVRSRRGPNACAPSCCASPAFPWSKSRTCGPTKSAST